jgi:tRNA modification GTPase
MTLAVDDTIAAIATAAGRGVRGIVRLSGPGTPECLDRCLSTGLGQLPGASRACCQSVTIECPLPIGSVPCQLYFWPTTSSFTRQLSAEIHLPGSPVLLDSVLEQLCHNGARLARPGEFTVRAFLAGRLDLTQVEAMLGVIHASHPEQLSDSLEQLAGGLATPLYQLRSSLLDLLAELEAGLDFVEEEIRFISRAALAGQLDEAGEAIERVARQLDSRRAAESDCRVVISGAPNVGKSTLFNRLAEAGSAIVSEQPGTTRDYLCCQLRLGDFRCLLIDTAGLDDEESTDVVDRASQQASLKQQQQADLVLFCLDGGRAPWEWEREYTSGDGEQQVLVVVTKSDLPVHQETAPLGLQISSRQGKGLEQLQHSIEQRIGHIRLSGHTTRLTASRCQESIRQAEQSIASARQLVSDGLGEELVAVELRTALDAIGQVTGEIYTDDILDRIFSRFCIGK